MRMPNTSKSNLLTETLISSSYNTTPFLSAVKIICQLNKQLLQIHLRYRKPWRKRIFRFSYDISALQPSQYIRTDHFPCLNIGIHRPGRSADTVTAVKKTLRRFIPNDLPLVDHDNLFYNVGRFFDQMCRYNGCKRISGIFLNQKLIKQLAVTGVKPENRLV